MKNLPFKVLLIFIVLGVAGSIHAQSSGSEYSNDLAWNCQVLAVQVPPNAGVRDTFCFAYSPGQTLKDLGFTATISATSVYNAGCEDPYTYNNSQLRSYSGKFSGSAEILEAKWHHNITTFSFHVTLSAYGSWAFRAYTPPNPPGGSASVGPFANTHGTCY